MEISLRGFIETGEVYLNGKKLSPRKSLKIINHSPDGFSWGYNGSGPAQLALAICLELYGNEGKEFYQTFKEDYVSILPQTNFERKIHIPDNYKFRCLSRKNITTRPVHTS